MTLYYLHFLCTISHDNYLLGLRRRRLLQPFDPDQFPGIPGKGREIFADGGRVFAAEESCEPRTHGAGVDVERHPLGLFGIPGHNIQIA
jgi:hypothetical protein